VDGRPEDGRYVSCETLARRRAPVLLVLPGAGPAGGGAVAAVILNAGAPPASGIEAAALLLWLVALVGEAVAIAS
jgi:hypothetical protein